jgi:hypothetical protein
VLFFKKNFKDFLFVATMGSSIEKCGDLLQEDCAKTGYKAGNEVNNCNHASISLTSLHT